MMTSWKLNQFSLKKYRNYLKQQGTSYCIYKICFNRTTELVQVFWVYCLSIPPAVSLLCCSLGICMSSKSLFLGVGVHTASAESVTPAVYTRESTDEHQTFSDAERKQQSLLTENSGSASLPCLLAIFHRTTGQR